MTERNIKSWIVAAELAKAHGRTPFFGAAVQAIVDDGSFFVVIFNVSDKSAIVGGITAKGKDLARLSQLGVEVER
jgi:hypothetical protein